MRASLPKKKERRNSMGVLAKWRENCAPIGYLASFLKTPWYPALFAVLCVISGTHNCSVYIPILWILTAFVLFSALFADDNKVFLTPLLMMFYALGQDADPEAFLKSNGDMLSLIDGKALVEVIIICAICVTALVARLVADGSLAAVFKKKRHFLWGIILLDAAFLANGLFSQAYDIKNIGIGAFFAAGLTVVYVIVIGILEKSENCIVYACYAMLATAYSAFLQMLTLVIRLAVKGDYFILFKSQGEIVVNRNEFTLGWGVATLIAMVFILGIPAALYLAKDRKYSLFTFCSAILFVLGTALINVRSAMVVGVLSFIVLTVFCCFKGNNRKLIRIYLLCCVSAAIVLLILVDRFLIPISSLFEKLSSLLRFSLDVDSGRVKLWANGISDFLSSPALGVGFLDGGVEDAAKMNNFFSNMYHCILIEIPGAMGIFGCFAFVLHIAQLIVLCIKRFCVDKLLLLFIPLMILVASLVDNFFFCLNCQIFYCVFLAVAEKYNNSTDDLT